MITSTDGVILDRANKQWSTRPPDERFHTLDELLKVTSERKANSQERPVLLKDVRADLRDGNLSLLIGGAPHSATHWSFGQFCSHISAPRNFLTDSLSPRMAAEVINDRIERIVEVSPEASAAVLTRNGGLRAITSQKYGRIWDADVVQMVQHVVDMSGGKFHNPPARKIDGVGTEPSGLYASDRDVFMFMIDGGSLLEVGPRAQFNRGFIVSNSEVGSGLLHLETFMFNVVCGNHFVFGATDIKTVKIRHNSLAPAHFAANALPSLREAVGRVIDTSPVKKAIDCNLSSITVHGERLGVDAQWHKAVADKFGLTQKCIEAAQSHAIAEEGGLRTLWDLIQGITAHARSIEHVDRRLDVERKAGKMLVLAN